MISGSLGVTTEMAMNKADSMTWDPERCLNVSRSQDENKVKIDSCSLSFKRQLQKRDQIRWQEDWKAGRPVA